MKSHQELAEVVCHKVVDNEELKRDEIKSEKMFEQPLFDGAEFSKTLGEKND